MRCDEGLGVEQALLSRRRELRTLRALRENFLSLFWKENVESRERDNGVFYGRKPYRGLHVNIGEG